MSTVTLTPREQELLVAVLENMKAEITWTEVAPKANYTTAKHARDKWAAVKAKLIAGGNKKKEVSENGGEATPKESAPTKKAAPKRKAAGEKTATKGKKAKTNAVSEVDDGEEGKVKSEEEDGGDGAMS